jgi:hypothetical protein
MDANTPNARQELRDQIEDRMLLNLKKCLQEEDPALLKTYSAWFLEQKAQELAERRLQLAEKKSAGASDSRAFTPEESNEALDQMLGEIPRS